MNNLDHVQLTIHMNRIRLRSTHKRVLVPAVTWLAVSWRRKRGDHRLSSLVFVVYIKAPLPTLFPLRERAIEESSHRRIDLSPWIPGTRVSPPSLPPRSSVQYNGPLSVLFLHIDYRFLRSWIRFLLLFHSIQGIISAATYVPFLDPWSVLFFVNLRFLIWTLFLALFRVPNVDLRIFSVRDLNLMTTIADPWL